MGERIGRIGRIQTDFFYFFTDSKHTHPKKIRSYPPDPPNPFSHRITTVSQHSKISNPKIFFQNPSTFHPKIRLNNT
jgi:hypothetical protein